MSSFRDLIVYTKAFSLLMDIFFLTKTFPKEETYSLVDQIRRSSSWYLQVLPRHIRNENIRITLLVNSVMLIWKMVKRKPGLMHP